MLRDLLDLIFPVVCPCCDSLLTREEKGVCIACLHDMEPTNFEDHPTDNNLFLRFAGLVEIAGAAAMYYFDKKGKLQKAIEVLKYKNQPQMGNALGEHYAQKLMGTEFIRPVDVIVPVPLHVSRLRERGYNQSLSICKGLSTILGIPVDAKNFVRHAKTVTQTQKSREERWQNVSSVFSLKKPLTGNILLVDDVITTGSTLVACIRALQAQEKVPESIRILSIGVTRKE